MLKFGLTLFTATFCWLFFFLHSFSKIKIFQTILTPLPCLLTPAPPRAHRRGQAVPLALSPQAPLSCCAACSPGRTQGKANRQPGLRKRHGYICFLFEFPPQKYSRKSRRRPSRVSANRRCCQGQRWACPTPKATPAWPRMGRGRDRGGVGSRAAAVLWGRESG